MPRADCYRCARPLTLCVCQRITPLPNRTRIHVVQHAHERRHAKGTARLLQAGLSQVDVHVLFPDPATGAVAALDLPDGTGLLYPSPDAIDLDDLGDHPAPTGLVVLDGTWSQAHRLYRDNAWIRARPHYKLSPTQPSRYRIREEPRFECLSCIEAVVLALRRLEPDLQGLDALDASFDAMIDAQLEAAARAEAKGRAAPSPKVVLPKPSPFPRPERVVVVYAEPSPARPKLRSPSDLVQLTAVRWDGAVFDAAVDLGRTLDAFERALLGLPDDWADDAPALPDVLAQFVAFAGPGPHLAAWNRGTHRVLAQLGTQGASCTFLKGEWANRTRGRVPDLEDVAATLDAASKRLRVRGRATERLAWAWAVAQHLHNAAGTA